MAVVGAQSLAIRGPPGAHNFILGNGEQKIAIAVEFDLVQGPFLYEASLTVSLLLSFFSVPVGKKYDVGSSKKYPIEAGKDKRTWPDSKIGLILGRPED